jgi:hypothetical protein
MPRLSPLANTTAASFEYLSRTLHCHPGKWRHGDDSGHLKSCGDASATAIIADWRHELLRYPVRGENVVATRRQELRKVAYTRIDAIAKDAKLQIEQFSLDTQTKLLAGGLESAEAKAFLESMPTPEQLMPPMTRGAIEAAIPKQLR